MLAHATWKRLFGFFWMICLVCTLWAAGLVICPKCGTEADAVATVCPHCGAVLPVVQKVTSLEPSKDALGHGEVSAGAISGLAADAVGVDARTADENMAKRPELSTPFYENALALLRLVKRDGLTVDTGKALAVKLEKCRRLLVNVSRPCSACNGSGKTVVHFQGMAGDKNAQTGNAVTLSDGPSCPVCNGQGTVTAGRSMDELRVLLGQGRRDFETCEQASGRVVSDRVWVPAEWLAVLDVKQQALLRTACPTPCSGCMGLGLQDCSHCKGAGRIKCSNEGCVKGWITIKVPNALSPKTAITRREMCPICHGTGMKDCPDCRGQGTGPCKVCNGTGRNAPCQECGAQGWAHCSKCQGSGKVAEKPCPDCHGEGNRLCPKCHGEGCAAK